MNVQVTDNQMFLDIGKVTEKSPKAFASGWRADCYGRNMKPSQSTHVWPQSRRGAFTLIELLTVIAIIGILAAILIPTISKVRETARFSTGVSNLREWARANILFANDHKGWVPHDGGPSQEPSNNVKVNGIGCWWNELPPYVGSKKLSELDDMRPSAVPTITTNSIFVCPNAQNTSRFPTQKPWLSYAPSFALSATGNSGFLTNVNRVPQPARTVLFAETTNHSPGQSSSAMVSTSNPRFLGDASVNNTRWRTKGIVSFFDGSVRAYTRQELAQQGTDLKGRNFNGPVWDLMP